MPVHVVERTLAIRDVRLIGQIDEVGIGQLSRLLVRLCPEREQSELKLRLSRVGESETKLEEALAEAKRQADNEAEALRAASASEKKDLEENVVRDRSGSTYQHHAQLDHILAQMEDDGV